MQMNSKSLKVCFLKLSRHCGRYCSTLYTGMMTEIMLREVWL